MAVRMYCPLVTSVNAITESFKMKLLYFYLIPIFKDEQNTKYTNIQ